MASVASTWDFSPDLGIFRAILGFFRETGDFLLVLKTQISRSIKTSGVNLVACQRHFSFTIVIFENRDFCPNLGIPKVFTGNTGNVSHISMPASRYNIQRRRNTTTKRAPPPHDFKSPCRRNSQRHVQRRSNKTETSLSGRAAFSFKSSPKKIRATKCGRHRCFAEDAGLGRGRRSRSGAQQGRPQSGPRPLLSDGLPLSALLL